MGFINFFKHNKISAIVIIVAVIFSLFLINRPFGNEGETLASLPALSDENLLARFDYLKSHGNSSCSSSFKSIIDKMADDEKIMGSCCSPMSLHHYQEQISGLKKYGQVAKIPADPYAVDAGLAQELWSYYDMELSGEEQVAYDYAMENSHEKGPCCCKCWRWYVYGGLGKYLIREHKFTGEQITEVWNLSDGCGGDEEHQHT